MNHHASPVSYNSNSARSSGCITPCLPPLPPAIDRHKPSVHSHEYFYSEDDEEDDPHPVLPPRSLIENANLSKLSMPFKSKSMDKRANSGVWTNPSPGLTPQYRSIPRCGDESGSGPSPLSLSFSRTSDINLIGSTPCSSYTCTEDFEENWNAWNAIDYEKWNVEKKCATSATCLSVHDLVEHHSIPELTENCACGDVNNINAYPAQITPAYSVTGSRTRASISLSLESTATDSNVTDMCLTFPFYSKDDELNFDMSQKHHNQTVDGVEIAKARKIGQDLFHTFHMSAWKEKKRAEEKQRKKREARSKKALR